MLTPTGRFVRLSISGFTLVIVIFQILVEREMGNVQMEEIEFNHSTLHWAALIKGISKFQIQMSPLPPSLICSHIRTTKWKWRIDKMASLSLSLPHRNFKFAATPHTTLYSIPLHHALYTTSSTSSRVRVVVPSHVLLFPLIGYNKKHTTEYFANDQVNH